jgi:hypothetical protein
MGFLTVYLAERSARRKIAFWFVMPIVTVSIALGGMLLALVEGAICIVMYLPIALVCGILGGIVAGIIARRTSRTVQNTVAMAVLALPLLVGPVARKLLYDYRVRTVATHIDIQAPADVVWRNIERVPSIRASELKPAWTRSIGFPAPDQATLSYEGIGAVRHATFRGGVLFIETVDTWEPNRRLAFSIHADADNIPNTTLDEHVRVGGPYFDVLHGDYEIEPLPNGITRLHLSSRHRVSTDFNWYAQLWTDAVMRNIQESILYVIKNRCERQAEGATSGR